MSGHYGYMQMPAGPYDPAQIPQIGGSGTSGGSYPPPSAQSASTPLQHGQPSLQGASGLPALPGDDQRKRKYDSDGEEEDDDAKGPKEKKERAGASEFVKKLYRMLDEGQFPDVVSWGETGDSFIVKDMNAFTKTILPLHFKHSNFASFVRQLNKYDFHKVKTNPNDPDGQAAATGQYGEQLWEFRHPNFKADMKESLEFIRRKAPTKPTKGKGKGADSPAPRESFASQQDVAALQAQIDSLHRSQQQHVQHINNLSQDYTSLFGEMMNFQRNMVAQDQLMQNLIQYLLNLEQDQAKQDKHFVPSSQAQKIISSYTTAARASYDQMTDFSRRASMSGQNLPSVPLPPPSFGQFSFGGDQDHFNSGYGAGQRQTQHPLPSAASQQQHHTAPPHASTSGAQPPANPSQRGSNSAEVNTGSTRRHASGWAVPPRVLLVEDDAVCRKLSSKFLQLFGCEIDVAVDGVSAVNKMNGQKYDLVLMDIMMPHLDGVSATSLIRQFDPNTPIISMTSNSSPNEIMTYFSHGMNDILPKPFTKEGLLDMLEKHLFQFKVVQQMAEIPRALGFSADQIQDALAASVIADEEGGNVMNPFSSMGISDTDYVEMLQGVAMQSEGKRAIEVVHDGSADSSRARFALYDQ